MRLWDALRYHLFKLVTFTCTCLVINMSSSFLLYLWDYSCNTKGIHVLDLTNSVQYHEIVNRWIFDLAESHRIQILFMFKEEAVVKELKVELGHFRDTFRLIGLAADADDLSSTFISFIWTFSHLSIF